jgi:hypothetical protein
MARKFQIKRMGEMSPREQLATKYLTARSNLLFVVIFTLINIIGSVFGSETYFLFSAHIPTFFAILGAILCGRYSPEYYAAIGMSDTEFFGTPVLVVLTAIAVVLTLLYLLFWALSKKRVGWLIAALVFFVADTAFMLLSYGISFDMLVDILFHALIVYYLVAGIMAHYKLKALPEEVPEAPDAEGDYEAMPDSAQLENSPILRRADMEVKHRVLLETEALGHKICYRRVKKVNELVIDNYVYAELESLKERAHVLEAQIDGHRISVGYDGFSNSYAMLDGNVITKKIRWY